MNEIEEKLDAKIPEYNKFDVNHPMKGVTWNKSKNLWRYNLEGNDKTNKNQIIIIGYAKQNLLPEKSKNILCDITKKILDNNDCALIKYIHNNKTYYDIRHILHYLSLKKSSTCDKYNSIKDKIIGIYFHKNIFNGYIIRELININTVKLLIKSTINPSVINLTKLLDIKLIDYKIP